MLWTYQGRWRNLFACAYAIVSRDEFHDGVGHQIGDIEASCSPDEVTNSGREPVNVTTGVVYSYHREKRKLSESRIVNN